MYTVKTLDGETLAQHLSQQVLSRRFPELGELIERGMADDASLYPKDHAPANARTTTHQSLDTGL